jgi:hypothetical protein
MIKNMCWHCGCNQRLRVHGFQVFKVGVLCVLWHTAVITRAALTGHSSTSRDAGVCQFRCSTCHGQQAA